MLWVQFKKAIKVSDHLLILLEFIISHASQRIGQGLLWVQFK